MRFIILLLILAPISVCAAIRLPAIIGDHMVLQQKADIKLWGWAGPAEILFIKSGWDTTTYSVKTDHGGKWSLSLKTPVAGGPYTISLKASNEIILQDVMIGEVWLCGGQSNMEWSGSQQLPQSLEEAPNATNTMIRFFYIPKSTSAFPQENVTAKWMVCSPEEMKKFSAIGYFFGKQINASTGYSIGLISANWGGTPAETWTPREIVMNDPLLKEAAGKLVPKEGWPMEPGLAFNAMIYPVTSYTIAGVLWYQGESNTTTNATYQSLFTQMIGSWRKAWNKDFPFYYVQIAPYTYEQENIGALLREAQTKSLSYPKTGMVVVSDLVDDVKNIHPKNKKDVAVRLANMALSEIYGQKGLNYKFPMYKNMTIEKDKVRISFYNAENGLVSRQPEPSGFLIREEGGNFLPARAKIEGSTILVWNKDVKKPVAVRFNFNNTDMPDIFSREGLPLNLFRTDNQ